MGTFMFDGQPFKVCSYSISRSECILFKNRQCCTCTRDWPIHVQVTTSLSVHFCPCTQHRLDRMTTRNFLFLFDTYLYISNSVPIFYANWNKRLFHFICHQRRPLFSQICDTFASGAIALFLISPKEFRVGLRLELW